MNLPASTQSSNSTVSGHVRWRLRISNVLFVSYLAVLSGAWLILQWADQWWPATILMFAPRWTFALPLLLLLPLAGLMRSRVIVAILLVSIIVSMPLMGFNVPWSQLSGRNPTGTPFRVMTINMHYNKGDPKPLEDLIVATAPDIVAVQEWQGYERTTIRTTPGWHVHATPGQFLASRYPIKKTVELGRNSMGENASVAHYELDTPVGTVNVFNLHTATSRDGIHDTIHENPKGTAEIRANSALRREQSMFVAGKAAECKGPLLIVGDFNTPCESTIFADVWSGYTDAFTATGWGWGYTFRGAKTTVRIDHILSGKGWTCTACRVGPYVGSPHRPVIAEMVWTGDIFTESP